MVSYFLPRGRFLIKAGNFRQVHQKHQQHNPQLACSKWPVLRNIRQSFSQKVGQVSQNKTKVESIIKSNNPHKKSNGISSSPQVNSQRELKKQHLNVWQRWTGFLLRLAPMGICVFGAFEWHLHRRNCAREKLPYTASEFQSKIYCSLPLRMVSRAWGWLAGCYIPETMRPYIYGWYSRVFNVKIEEALYSDFRHYRSMSEFFTRPLKEGVRTIDANALVVSPADGKILHFGTATKSLIEQVKGVNYNIKDFLGPATWVNNKNQNSDYEKTIKHNQDDSTALYQCVIYLAPGDYHRFHSPVEWQPSLRRHFTGELLSVSPKIATWLPGLFCLNERALYVGDWKHGFFSYTAVGATNVGSLQIVIDQQLKTNQWVGFKSQQEYNELTFSEKPLLEKGSLVGQFNMGSTIVLIFEAPSNFKFNIDAGQKIRVGEPLGILE